MLAKTIIKVVLALTCLIGLLQYYEDSTTTLSHAQQSATFTYQNISGLLLAPLKATAFANETIAVGDAYGGLNFWYHDAKKETILYKSTDRKITPLLPSPNEVINVQMLNNHSILSLTKDGILKSTLISSNYIITQQATLPIQSKLNSFLLLSSTYLLGISQSSTICLYSSPNLFSPSPIVNTISCNTSKDGYLNAAYSSANKIIATGNNRTTVVFGFDEEKEGGGMSYLFQVNLPKSQENIFNCQFNAAGMLVVVNGLWVSSLSFDLTAQTGKVLSSVRVQKSLPKGQADSLSLYQNKTTTTVLLNGHLKGQLYTLTSAGKLTLTNDSKQLGNIQSFHLVSVNHFIRTVDTYLQLIDFSPNASDTKVFKIAKSQTIDTANHYTPVNKITSYGDTIVSVSDGGDNNFKIWKQAEKSIQLIDQKTITFFSLLKSGYVNLKSLIIIPPVKYTNHNLIKKEAKNETLHILTAGSDPFELILITLASTGKIGEVFKTNQSHSGNITFLSLSKDQTVVVSGSKDTTLGTWAVSSDRKAMNRTNTTRTNNGPISFGIIDSTKTYIIVGHDSTPTNKLANITIWKLDEKGAKLSKLAQNVPGEAYQSNITSAVLSLDEKLLITLSEKGQLKLWRHQSWTMVDLMASLSLGFYNGLITLTKSGKLLIQTDKQFILYYFDSNGFIFNDKVQKSIIASPSVIFQDDGKLYEGGKDGAIRIYSYSQ